MPSLVVINGDIMTIDFANFTPLMSLIGGMLIGLAALFLMAMNGRVMGISGILGGLTNTAAKDKSWRIAFIIGTILGPFLVMMASGTTIEIRPVSGGVILMTAGLLVGLGTSIGSGCTSGHGICGLARFSTRSLAAVCIFMATAIATVALIRHVL